jgi:hypothetical protein
MESSRTWDYASRDTTLTYHWKTLPASEICEIPVTVGGYENKCREISQKFLTGGRLLVWVKAYVQRNDGQVVSSFIPNIGFYPLFFSSDGGGGGCDYSPFLLLLFPLNIILLPVIMHCIFSRLMVKPAVEIFCRVTGGGGCGCGIAGGPEGMVGWVLVAILVGFCYLGLRRVWRAGR